MEFPFEFDLDTTALIIEVRGFSFALLTIPENSRFQSFTRTEAQLFSDETDDSEDHRKPRKRTPAVNADEAEGYLILHFNRHFLKHGFTFGRSKSSADVRLPQSITGGISGIHFTVFLS